MIMGRLLVRGLAAGLIAAALSVAFAEVSGEPEVDRAIAFEAQARGDHNTSGMPGMPTTGSPSTPAPEMVSRIAQKTVGLATAVAVVGVAFGGAFAIAFAVVWGRMGVLSVRGTALLLALAAFGAIYLVPALKYPASPPAVGEPATIALRTQLYFAMMLISVVASIGAAILWRRLLDRVSSWNAGLIACGALLIVIVVAFLALPGIDEVPDTFPASVLWRFRVASAGTQLVLWTGIGLIFGVLAERTVEEASMRTSSASARA
jgi:predicted cobalt transporter CbtA